MNILSTINKKQIVFFLLAFILFFTRIISFREFSLDPDELEWMYVIRRCLVDPRPFVGFDAHTSGPFAIYLLAFLKIITGFSKLYQLRLITFFAFILPSFYLIYQISPKGSKIVGILAFSVMVSAKNFAQFGYFYDGVFSYNTEYQILIYTSILFWILRVKNSFKFYVFYVLILFLLPFVKFQALPITCFFLFFLMLKLTLEKQWKWLIKLGLIYVLFNGVWLLYLYVQGLFPEFYYAYIGRNLNYMSNSNFGESSINPANFLRRITDYYFFLIIFFLIFFYQVFVSIKGLWKSNIFELFIHPLSQSFFFLITAVFTIVVSKNDFGHYYIYLFLPVSIFISDLYQLVSKQEVSAQKPNYTLYAIFVILLISNYNFDFLGKSIGFLWNKLNHKNIEQFNFGKSLPSLVDEPLVHWLKIHHRKEESILILDWTKGQAMYYLLMDQYQVMSRSSNIFTIVDSFKSNNKAYFNKEEQIVLEDLNANRPLYIVDTWNLLPEIKGTKIPQFVAQNYQLKVSTDKYQIYERNDLKK